MRHRLSLFTTLLTFTVLLLGNLVVATEAGDACGSDWPKCNGSYIPDFTDPLIVIEYTHRLVTGSLGFVILINFWVAWRKKIPGENAVKKLAPLTVLLLFTQAFVGGLNVLLETPPGFTTIDVAISLLMFKSIILLTIALYRKPVNRLEQSMDKEHHHLKQLFKPALLANFLFYLQVVLGAFFKHSAASEVYMGIDFSERLIHSFTLSELIYSIHGIFSFVIIVSAAWMLFYAWKNQVLQGLTTLYISLVLLETLIGFSTVLTGLAVLSSSLHMITATVTLGVGAMIIGISGLGRYYRMENFQGDLRSEQDNKQRQQAGFNSVRS